MNIVSAPFALPSKSTTCKYSYNLAQSLPISASPNSLGHSLGVHLQTRSFTGSKCIFWVPSISASRCVSGLAQLRPAISHHHGLQVHLQTRSIQASKLISEFTRSQSPSAYSNLLNYGLPVHLGVHSISVSKCISNTLDQVHLQGEAAVIRRYRGNRCVHCDGEYIFGILWSRWTLSHFHLLLSYNENSHCMFPRYRSH
jgi:hypothetical protein